MTRPLRRFAVRVAGKIVGALAGIGIIVPTQIEESLVIIISFAIAAFADFVISFMLPDTRKESDDASN